MMIMMQQQQRTLTSLSSVLMKTTMNSSKSTSSLKYGTTSHRPFSTTTTTTTRTAAKASRGLPWMHVLCIVFLIISANLVGMTNGQGTTNSDTSQQQQQQQQQQPPPSSTELPPPIVSGTILEVLKAIGDFETFLSLIDTASGVLNDDGDDGDDTAAATTAAATTTNTLASILNSGNSNGGPITVFAPRDVAFEQLPLGTKEYLMNNVDTILLPILQYHVAQDSIGGGISNSGTSGSVLFSTFNTGETLELKIFNGTSAMVNNKIQVKIIGIIADNGIIHVIDTLLLPTNIILPLPILRTMEGMSLSIEDPTTSTSTSNSVDVFVKLLKSFDESIWELLKTPGPITLFVPSDSVWKNSDAYPVGIDDWLLLSKNRNILQSILQYHIIKDLEEIVTTTDIASVGTTTIPTLLEGQSIHFNLNNKDQYEIITDDTSTNVNEIGKLVVTPDIVCTNGIIHIIDGLLLPPTIANTLVFPPPLLSNLESLPETFSTLLSILNLPNNRNDGGILLNDVLKNNPHGPYSKCSNYVYVVVVYRRCCFIVKCFFGTASMIVCAVVVR